MQKKWVWGLSLSGALAIMIILAVYSVNNYNERLQAGGSNNNDEQNESQLLDEADDADSSKKLVAVSAEVEAEAVIPTEPERVLAPEFKLQDLDGNDISIKDFRGKKVFLTFWATWCQYCKKQMPFMQELQEEAREDLVILTVATADSIALEKHMKDNGFTFRVVQDYRRSSDKIQLKYKTMTIPGNFLIDEEGYIVAKRNSFSTREVMDKFLSEFNEL